MQSSQELQATALQEFEVIFGDIIRDLDRDGDFYRHFQQEFLQGVRHGLDNPRATREEIELEGGLRRILSPFSHEGATKAEEGAAKCGSLSFMYGASWAVNLVNGVGL